MSFFIAGAITGTGLLAGLLVALSEHVRAKLRRDRETAACRHAVEPAFPKSAATTTRIPNDSAPVSAESRAAAFREILEALGDDLDEEIAEWEAVLSDFPQVIDTDEVCEPHPTSREPRTEVSESHIAAQRSMPAKEFSLPHRTRRIDSEERGMIQRLMKTGFAPEEIALWLNLPLERVHELLFRDGLT